MLKITKRPNSKYLQIRGTYKTPFKNYKIEYESTGTISRKKSRRIFMVIAKTVR